jgi:glutaredoxin
VIACYHCPTMRAGVIVAATIAGLAFTGGCRHKGPPAPPPGATASTGAVPLEVTAGAELVFTYLDSEGRFRSVDKLEAVPAPARAVVRVVDPKRPPEQRADTERVFVADLSQPVASGRYPTKLVDRDVFESAAFAQLPPGDGSKFAVPGAPVPLGAAPPGAGAPPPGAGAPRGGPAAPVARNRDRIILYGTQWCGACAKAREWLRRRGVSFDDKDPERDPAAAAELHAKAARAGIQPDRVPIIDVRGTLLQGFDPKRLEALLGTPI